MNAHQIEQLTQARHLADRALAQTAESNLGANWEERQLAGAIKGLARAVMLLVDAEFAADQDNQDQPTHRLPVDINPPERWGPYWLHSDGMYRLGPQAKGQS